MTSHSPIITSIFIVFLQASTIPGVIVAKPNQTTPGVIIPGGSIRPANATNFILKGKAIPLVLEKNKNPVQNCNDLVMTTTGKYKYGIFKHLAQNNLFGGLTV